MRVCVGGCVCVWVGVSVSVHGCVVCVCVRVCETAGEVHCAFVRGHLERGRDQARSDRIRGKLAVWVWVWVCGF